MIILWSFILSLGALAAAWWLSGYDPELTPKNYFWRRALRCLVTIFIVGIFFGLRPTGYWFVALILVLPLSLGLIWRSCLSELCAGGIVRMIDPDLEGEFDPDKGLREVEHVAALLRKGHREKALQHAEKIMKSGDAAMPVLETLLVRHGIDLALTQPGNPLAQADRLRMQGNFVEAEKFLMLHMERNPADHGAALLLIRLYAQDLKQEARAMDTLRLLEKQPHVPAWQVDYARRSIPEWVHAAPAPAPEALPESVDELLAQGYSGTAVEILEQKIREQPNDFDLWLKLAEAKGKHLGDHRAAEKIVRKMEKEGHFSAGRIEMAKAKLAEWKRP